MSGGSVGTTGDGANALYALATDHGLLSLVSVLGSLYPLTTVLLPHFEMGAIAAELLFDMAARLAPRPDQIKVECPIVERKSV